MFASASGLSDSDLLARIAALAVKERAATVELVAHLAALDARPALYAAQGFGSLFGYCTQALGLSEDAACSRIAVARTCRRFPIVLDALASGAVSLTSVRMLSPALTETNHEAVLARASGRRYRAIEALVAELAPRPDVPSSVRKVPTRVAVATPVALSDSSAATVPAAARSEAPIDKPTPEEAPRPPLPPTRRPIIENTSPERYRVQFTVGKSGHDTLRRLQELLRREIPDGDPGAIVERALALLLAKVEKDKLGAASKPRPIRPETDSLIRTQYEAQLVFGPRRGRRDTKP